MADVEKIIIVKQKILSKTLNSYLGAPFKKMIKITVDVKKNIIALGGEMHADSEKVLLEEGSKQEDVWGANLYPLQDIDKRIEFTSLINIRPSQDNLSMEILSIEIQNHIKKTINDLIQFENHETA